MKKQLVILVCMLVPAFALAQPSGSAGSGSSAGSAADPAPPIPTPSPLDQPDVAALRKACVDAMNADPAFGAKIVETADANAAQARLKADLEQHEKAAATIAKNQKHVILAYAAMWLVAVGFLLFLWRRQQLLRNEIASLKVDLDAATKDGK